MLPLGPRGTTFIEISLLIRTVKSTVYIVVLIMGRIFKEPE